MKSIIYKNNLLVLALACILGFVIATPAFADHGDEPEVTTHAETAHEHDDEENDDVVVGSTMTVVTAGSDVDRMQKLVVVLQQLVDLLKKKAELVHNATPHEHEENEEHNDEHNDEDHD